MQSLHFLTHKLGSRTLELSFASLLGLVALLPCSLIFVLSYPPARSSKVFFSFFLGARGHALFWTPFPTLSLTFYPLPCLCSLSSFLLRMVYVKKEELLFFVLTLSKSLSVKLKYSRTNPMRTKAIPPNNNGRRANSQQSLANWQYRKHSPFFIAPSIPQHAINFNQPNLYPPYHRTMKCIHPQLDSIVAQAS